MTPKEWSGCSTKKPDPSVSPLRALILQQLALAFRTRQYRGWVEKRSPKSGH